MPPSGQPISPSSGRGACYLVPMGTQLGGDGSPDSRDVGPSAASGGGRKRWPWWKIVGAVLVWPFTVLWWVWRRSPWGQVSKILATVAVVSVIAGYYAMIATLPNTSRTAPAAPPGVPSQAATPQAPNTSAGPGAPSDPHAQLLKSSDLGDLWPLTVPEATVTCRTGGAVVLTAGGKDVAVNGTAMTLYKSMTRIADSGLWRDATTGAGPKVDIGPIIDIGLDLCDGKRFTPGPVAPATAKPSPLQVPAAAPVSKGCDAAFKAWEPKGGAVEPSDPLVVATLTKCANVAEWRGGLEAHPAALDYETASEIGPGTIRSDLLIICGSEQRGTPVCADAVTLEILG